MSQLLNLSNGGIAPSPPPFTVTTVNNGTGNLITVALGATPATYQFEARVKGFDSATPAGVGYNVYGTFRTDGVNATLIGNQDIFNEDAALQDADAYFIASGNDAILQVLGQNTKTIVWNGTIQVT